jgi:hypothetical protein
MSQLRVYFLVLVSALAVVAGCKSETDDQFPIALAFGTPPSGLYELHVGVEPGMKIIEGPAMSQKGNLLWDDWVSDHFELKDASGNAVKFSRANNSRLMPTSKIAGTFEFYLTAPVKKGGKYIMTYQPKVDEKLKYRHEFTAPDSPKDPLRTWFKPDGRKR